MKMNLRQIEVFRAVMLTGSISGASKLLYVSQPAISRLMSHTEQRLGLELFRRVKGRLHPTPEARRLLGEVNVVYEGIERVNEIAEDLATNRTGSLRISCSPNLGQTVLPRAIASFRAAHPAVRIVVRTQIPGNMLRALRLHQHPRVFLSTVAPQAPDAPAAAPSAQALSAAIAHVQPSVVLVMGRLAARAAMGRSDPLGRLRAQPHSVAGVPAIVTYDAPYLLRAPQAKAAAWADLCRARALAQATPTP